MSPSVLIGISGGIAAYKTPLLVRLLVQSGIQTHVVMTDAAMNFVTPLTLATLTGNPVCHDMWGERDRPSVEHISLADNADFAVIAPATANIIGKIACGIADDMLTTVFMALRCPVLVCPSMNVNMFRNPIVQENLKKLEGLGYHLMEPESGYLACGWNAEGRMPEPEKIAQKIHSLMGPKDLAGEHILVTAGPTEEPLDPVRFITNRSSGKMGVAISDRAIARGAKVTLVAGPIRVQPACGVRHISVRTALEMRDRVMDVFRDATVVIKAAAVSDFRPTVTETEKVKKEEMTPTIVLTKNPDILAELGRIKREDQIIVGFAAETQDVLQNGRTKLRKKNLDMLVLNDVSKPGAGFDCDTNIVRFLHRSGDEEQMEIMSKDKVADLILDRVRTMRTAAQYQRNTSA
ncbi:MAG: bifunctional phosphopantothenoylcysteine decarboxylase/phosphopantothenate--cysteine ligase CoaBC [Desulfomonile tiedjei]|uniref:Coenzyme A biosynthesis bifunctional protein CoaBC n=1 Tax=Desulfomonile tiedjei TaxID=2358 RepID=A0A9D6V502_9BACT|nr:bifunctional phosphopantothenoylcysteine decarboxylase/phosphopantothenate--cysteine ligase CoaBC [Desulfomonile tiedjei]